jgi:hypothetical protein
LHDGVDRPRSLCVVCKPRGVPKFVASFEAYLTGNIERRVQVIEKIVLKLSGSQISKAKLCVSLLTGWREIDIVITVWL